MTSIRQNASPLADQLKTFAGDSYGGTAYFGRGYSIPRIDTAANWTAANPILDYLEIGYESDTGLRKIGDSVTAWASLGYFTPVLNKIPAPTASVSMNSQKITSLATPTATTDAVTKAYVDDNALYSTNNTLLPTGAIAQAYDRYGIAGTNSTNITTGSLFMMAVHLPKGAVCSSVTFVSGTTAGASMTNQWAILTDSSRVVKAVSPDGTSGAWSANSTKTFTFGTPFTTTYTGLHYIGINVTGTTPPNLLGSTTPAFTNTVEGIAPIVCATADSGLTTPLALAATTAALTLSRFKPYFYIS